MHGSEAGDVCFISCQQISAGRVFDFNGVLFGIPSADQTRITFHALHKHDGRDVRSGRGLNFHNDSLPPGVDPGNARTGSEAPGLRAISIPSIPLGLLLKIIPSDPD